MNQVVYNQRLELTDIQEIHLPKGSKILSCQAQNSYWCLWYLCNPEAEDEPRTIITMGTGHAIECREDMRKMVHIDTIQQGPYVWHVFESVKVGD